MRRAGLLYVNSNNVPYRSVREGGRLRTKSGDRFIALDLPER